LLRSGRVPESDDNEEKRIRVVHDLESSSDAAITENMEVDTLTKLLQLKSNALLFGALDANEQQQIRAKITSLISKMN
jgi:hypothetical protein